ncbi:MAG: ATP-binding cassette domain-containing protein [Chloroflexi bacterium]|nr:ATP-binding cassette domain-containing protein [Chloroflexota bacterium]
MSVLSVYKLRKAFNIYPVFKDITFQVNAGEKVALVGVNGAGKSTLLRIIAGEESADSGEIVTSRGLKVAYLPQEASFSDEGDTTLYAEMMSVFSEVRTMQAELTGLEEKMVHSSESGTPEWDSLMERYAELTHAFEMGGGYDYEVRIGQVLSGLNFDRSEWERPMKQFSGGQKTRAALARTLLKHPDLLMLDEPTNHLDLKTLEWLEEFLHDYEGSLVVISHDRYFLDRVVTRVLDLSFGRMEDYPGNYSKYLMLRGERIERMMQQYEAQQEHISKTEDFIRRYKAGQRYRQARGRQKQLNRLQRLERPKEKDKLHLSLQTDLRGGRLVLATEDLAVGYRGQEGASILFKAPNLEMERTERVAIIGPNGCGKSTFLKTIMGEMTPLEGLVELGTNVKVAYYAQAHEGLNFGNTVLEEILWTQPMTEGAARNFLGRFLFSGDDVYKKISDLSGGERSRVALAKLTLAKANLLILDEPTNHLDINAREALEDVLTEYNGTLLFVSHDRYFIDVLATQVWEVGEGYLKVYLGNYTDYLDWLSRAKLAENQLLGGAASSGGAVSTGGAASNKSGAASNKSNGKSPGGAISTGGAASNKSGAASNKSNGKSPGGAVSTGGAVSNKSDVKVAPSKDEKYRRKKITELETTIAELEKRLTLLSEEMTQATMKQAVTLITRLGQEYQQTTDNLEKLYVEWGLLSG